MIKISLPDGSSRDYAKGSTPMDVANSISSGLARAVVSAKYNDTTVEASTPLLEDGSLVLFTFNDPEGKKAFWHSTAHLMAQAVLKFFPNAKLTIGPAIENGFYYDIDLGEESISDKDFKRIEDQMIISCEIINTWIY